MKLFKGKKGTAKMVEPVDLDHAIIVLGACCSKSSETFENVKEAAKLLGIQKEVVNIGDYEVIASFGVMTTPGLVIDRVVYSQGRKLSVDDAKRLIEKSLEG